ncbi:MAG: VanZ family protein [Gemmatimonadota bacterium]
MIHRLTAWGPAAAWAAVLFFLSAIPDTGLPSLRVNDKLIHVVLYLIWGGTLAWGRLRNRGRPGSIVLLGLGILYAAGDEIHQAFVPGRDPSLGDLGADAVGLILGYGLTIAFLRRAGWGSFTGAGPFPEA